MQQCTTHSCIKLFLFRSSNSWLCPSCSNCLSTKATNYTIPPSNESEKPIPKKSYYLICHFCRWTSRSVGIPDKDIGEPLRSGVSNTWHACQIWHATTLKVACELLPYFVNMLQYNFKYPSIVYCCSIVLIKLVSDFHSFCSSILTQDV